ncbi:sensor histidine kinase [Kocuria rosea]|uniref:sensor histidine kinase n=1 Tax=Kocuria rosea TaxID=1275 RepID=UPI001643A663|nr:HAMP domain-containing sensor histidine kinase [Kocuria rosea]MCM3485097.1 HAMP domain-containing histidine kinase [Kocuria rosea]
MTVTLSILSILSILTTSTPAGTVEWARLFSYQLPSGHDPGLEAVLESMTEGRRLPGQTIERNTDQPLSLVDDLLNSHRDAADLHVVPADLVALPEQSAEAAQPHTERAGITVKAWAPDTLVVGCDPVRLRQVLDNLISHAIKYSPPNSTVFVLGTQSGDSAQVQVIGHGHGMSPEEVRRVFEKFYRGATARMSTTPGWASGWP